MGIFLYSGFSQEQYPNIGVPIITHFSRMDYAGGTQNWSIRQQKNGLLYIANNKGLMEFDGSQWQLYALPNHTIVRSIALDDTGRIFIGGQNELGYLIPDKQGKLTYQTLTHLIPESLRSFEDVWEIFIQDEVFYFCTEKVIFKLKNDEFEAILPPNQRFKNFFHFNNRIWAQDKGLYEIEGTRPVLTKGSEVFDQERIVALLPHVEHEMLVLTTAEGFFYQNQNEFLNWNVPANKFVKTEEAYTATSLSNGNYAVGTTQNGLICINQTGQPVLHLNKDKGLQNNTVLSVFQDRQQNIWLGLDNGVDYVETNAPFLKIESEEGITGTGYSSIIHNNKIFFGTNQGLFYTEWIESSPSIEVPKIKLTKNGIGQVWSIDELNESIVVGQHKGASYLENDQLNQFSIVNGAWKFAVLKKHPNYAIEGAYDGLYLYKKNENNDWILEGKLTGFDESARVFEEDERGNIWVSHAYKGLYRIRLNPTDKLHPTVELYGESKGWSEDLLVNVSKIRGEIIFTSPHGIYQYDESKDQIIPHPIYTEIFGENRNVQRLLEDNLGNIWFSIDDEFGFLAIEEKGLVNDYQFRYFNQLHGDLVDGFEHIYAYDSAHIFIGTEKGFIHFQPNKQKNVSFPFNVLIREVVETSAGDSILYNGDINASRLKEKPTFAYHNNDFRFAFSTPYFEQIDFLNYRFKLEGFEEEWSSWSSKTEKEYTNLAAGNYSFKVQAKNAYGELSEVADFDFKIKPAWYASLFAKAIYLIMSGLFLFFGYRYVVGKEQKKTTEFKEAQEKKLEKKEAEFIQEVRKSENEIMALRNEKLQSDINHKNSQLASATMHLVQKSEILIKIKNDLNAIQSDAPATLKKKIKQISRAIDSDIQLDDNWEQFESYFDQVHENFFKRLRQKFPELTPKDQKLCAYLRMNLTTKEIAPLLNISVRGVEISRYRLRKKLGIASEVNLVSFIMEV